MWQTLTTSSIALLLSHFFIFALLFYPSMVTQLFYFLIPALFSRLFITTLFSHFLILVLLSHLPVTIFSSLYILILLSCFILDLALTHLISSVLGIFKQHLSDKHLHHYSTSSNPTTSFYLFLTLDLLSEKNDYKRLFNTAFINSCLFTRNHTTKEIDLSFRKYGYFIPVKFN